MTNPDAGREFTSIDVDELGQAVDDLDSTLTGLADHIARLESDFDFFGVDKSNLNKLLEAERDLEDIMPDMRRRHSLAVHLLAEHQNSGTDGDGVLTLGGTDILNDDFGSIAAARNAGDDLADQVNNGNGEIPPEVYEQLQQYGHDPDFAEAFVDGLTPLARGRLLQDADSQAQGAPGDEGDEAPRLAVAGVFSTASFRIDYDADFFRDIGRALRDDGSPGSGIGQMQAFIPLMQHGEWNHEALTSVAEAAFSGDSDVTGPYNAGEWRAGVWSGLARNPRASAEYMAEHRDGDEWDVVPTGDNELQNAYADFIQAATVDARSVYVRLGLYDDDLPNLAEQNAAFLIEEVGSLGRPGDFSEPMRMAFVNITEEYWDDFMYSFSAPGGVAGNPDRDGIEVDPALWDAFITEGMRSEEGAARTLELFDRQIGETRDDRVGDYDETDADSAHATGWDAYINRRLGNLFVSNWEQVLNEREADAQAREDFRNEVVSFLIAFAFDPRATTAESLAQMPQYLAEETVGNILSNWLGDLTEEEVQELDTSVFGDRQTWMDYANGMNDQGTFPIDPPYEDDGVTWDGDPESYEEEYGVSFRDDFGNILPLSEIRKDPDALAAYNAWLQDPAVQLTTDPLFQPEVHGS